MWVLEKHDLHLPITISLLQAKALELIEAENPEFKASAAGLASSCTIIHLLTCKNIHVTRTTHYTGGAYTNFPLSEIETGQNQQVRSFQIMDETPLYFDVVPGRVIDKKGKKSVVVHTTGNAKRHLTIVLTVLAHAYVEVLPALAIFKRKKRPELHEVYVFI